MMLDIHTVLEKELERLEDHYQVCGLVDRAGLVYPLGADTKVLSTVFELITRPVIYTIAEAHNLDVVEPFVQNHYPDFTLHKGTGDHQKIAIDVKTTYRDKPGNRFKYTLGGYTSFIRPGNETKNIVFPFSHYESHWIIGFVYERLAKKKAAANRIYKTDELTDIPLPFKNVEVFVQEKWKVSGDRAGSGNTTNIGSINGTMEDFREGRGVFSSEKEFLEYWIHYGRTRKDRDGVFHNINEFHEWRKHNRI